MERSLTPGHGVQEAKMPPGFLAQRTGLRAGSLEEMGHPSSTGGVSGVAGCAGAVKSWGQSAGLPRGTRLGRVGAWRLIRGETGRSLHRTEHSKGAKWGCQGRSWRKE